MKYPLHHPAFYLDSSACSGCKTCMVACADGRDLPEGVLWRRVTEYSGGEWRQGPDGVWTHTVFAYYVSVSCNHCESPACMAACPKGAISQTAAGVVAINPTLCIGCGRCRKRCPYSAPQPDRARGVMTKCDCCTDRLAAGKEPLCVVSCPMRALRFGEYETLQQEYGNAAHSAPLPDAIVTKPRLVLTPHPDAQPAGSSEGTIANPEEI